MDKIRGTLNRQKLLYMSPVSKRTSILKKGLQVRQISNKSTKMNIEEGFILLYRGDDLNCINKVKEQLKEFDVWEVDNLFTIHVSPFDANAFVYTNWKTCLQESGHILYKGNVKIKNMKLLFTVTNTQ